MAKGRLLNANKLAAGIMLSGGLFLAYALFHSSSNASIPGWVPVNEPLKAAIDHLQNTHEPDSMKSLPTPSNSSSTQSGGVAKGNGVGVGTKSEEARSRPEVAAESQAAKASTANESSILLDLNHATQSELEELPGIGPSKAKAIILYREQHNGFRNVEQLLEVKGIGPKVLERLTSLIRVSAAK